MRSRSHLSSRWQIDTTDQIEQSRFAGAAPTQQDGERTLMNVEINIVKDGMSAIALVIHLTEFAECHQAGVRPVRLSCLFFG